MPSTTRSLLLSCLAVAACTAPPPQPLSLSSAPTVVDDVPRFDYRHAPEAAPLPEPPIGHVGPNGQCPRLRVFSDAEDLCRRGILADIPLGWCGRLGDEGIGSEVEATRTRTQALGGRAELFIRHWLRSDDRDDIYLALRGDNGYVLLGQVAEFYSQSNDVPEFRRFRGDDDSLELVTRQTWWFRGPDDDEVTLDERLSCTRDEHGTIRCDHQCPDMALDLPLPPLDCEAVRAFDWSALPRADDYEWDATYEGDVQMSEALGALGLAWAQIEPYANPPRARATWVQHRELTLLQPKARGRWVLMRQQLPLLTSSREMRIGEGPGGYYVRSWKGKREQIHRLDLETATVEAVLPGVCGELNVEAAE